MNFFSFLNNFRLLCSFRTLGLNDLKIASELTSSFPSSPKVPSSSEPKQNYPTIYQQFSTNRVQNYAGISCLHASYMFLRCSGEQARNYEDILRTLRPIRRAELGVIRHIILIAFDCATNSNRSLIKILMLEIKYLCIC